MGSATKYAIELQEAVKIATKTLREIYKGKRFHNLLLEEVELIGNGREWLITLGFDVSAKPKNGSLASIVANPERKYKQFCINAKSGNVKSMKIRTV